MLMRLSRTVDNPEDPRIIHPEVDSPLGPTGIRSRGLKWALASYPGVPGRRARGPYAGQLDDRPRTGLLTHHAATTGADPVTFRVSTGRSSH
jgi:hypothetical protein